MAAPSCKGDGLSDNCLQGLACKMAKLPTSLESDLMAYMYWRNRSVQQGMIASLSANGKAEHLCMARKFDHIICITSNHVYHFGELQESSS